MTLDNAIEIKEKNIKRYALFMSNEEFDAEMLGIEALEEVKRIRLRIPLRFQRPLPGETEK